MRFVLQLLLLFLLLILPWTGFSQYTNEWVRQGQQYYRIPIAKKGIYRLAYSDLQNAGVPVAAIDPRLIQLFHRGKEQSIFVQGQADAVLNSDDYIEFYGQANDGTLDKILYKPSTAQPHNYYNLFSDTTAYFLTWSIGAVPGKRVTTYDEVNVTNIPKEIAHNAERLVINKTQYSGGVTVSDVIQYTHFDIGEGWTGNAIIQGQFIDYTIDLINNIEISAGNPQIELLLVGRDESSHTAEILVGPNSSSLRSISSTAFVGFESVMVTMPLNWSDIGVDGKLVVRLTAPSSTTNRPQFSASYLKLTVPQSFQSTGLTEKEFHLQVKSTGRSFVEWTNAPASMRLWDVSDPMSIISIGTRASGTSLTAMVGSTETPRTLYAFTSTSTPPIRKVSFRLIDPKLSDYIIISNKVLMKPALGYLDAVKEYAGYRASAEGGSYDTLVVSVDQLYNQFNYGETSPTAIYEFMRFMVERGNPKYLFLIGKGRDVWAGFHRMTNPGSTVYKDLVPSAGVPGSDMNFTVGLAGTTHEPAVPTGRLSAVNPQEVVAYMNKIKETESAPLGQAWQKRGLHLSGGIRTSEIPLFRYFVDRFKAVAEKEYWGASVKTISRQDPSLIELINVSSEINDGVNLVTFFGHSSANDNDIDIGYVTDQTLGYNNPGKYPAFLINGCNAGAFFLNGAYLGENWINAANRGARNFIANSSYGFPSLLHHYSNLFYMIGFADSVFINKGIGDVQKEVARVYMNSAQPIMQNIAQVQQMMLLGDPAVKLFSSTKPDYEIINSGVSLFSFDGKPVTALVDSFALKLVVKNHGQAPRKPIKIKITRTLTNGIELTYDSTFQAVFNSDTLIFKIHRGDEVAGGNTTFKVQLDPDNTIKEFNEGNNSATFETFIPNNTTLHLFPLNYGIVNQKSVQLIWQASDPLSAKRDFQIEIDTTLLFTSPYLIKKLVAGKVLASAAITLTDKDSTVYYWRTRFDKPTNQESNEWVVSSFSFIQNSPEGWAQLSKNQLRENFFSGLVAAGDGKPFKFEEHSTSVNITTFGSNNPASYTDVSVMIDNAEYSIVRTGLSCRNNTLNLIAFNKSTVVPYAAIPFVFPDLRLCGRAPQFITSFQNNEFETGLNNDLIAVIDRIGVSDSVVLFSIGDPGYSSWSSTVKSKLGELGIGLTELNNLQSGEPVIIFGKKGTPPGSATMFKSPLSPANEQLLSVTKKITGRKTEGIMKSVLIGPAAKWNQFMMKSPFVEPSDQITILIYGVDNTGNETLITSNAMSGFDLSQLSVDQFPYLKVVFDAKDEINLTPADWKNWIVLYEAVAEGVLFYKGTSQVKTLQEGQFWSTQFGFTNISEKIFNSPLKVELDVVTQETQHHLRKDSLITAPAPHDTTFFNVYSSTVGKVGSNDVNVYVNKKVVPEQYYDNNYATLSGYLMVKPDKTHPVLAVTFDGRILRNGDFVSSTPFIQMSLSDENPFMLKTDTMGVTVLLSYPCATDNCSFTRIPLSSGSVKWFPATLTSDFYVDFTPTELVDGQYVLSVQATDASGNLSGAVPYEITFNVKSNTELNFKGVYPNPSSIGFFFNFELSGNILPEDFLLEVFSSTGQLVTRFGIEDIEKFYIGTNEIVWNGTDTSGKLLANGVYLYRMNMQTNGVNVIETGRLVWIR